MGCPLSERRQHEHVDTNRNNKSWKTFVLRHFLITTDHKVQEIQQSMLMIFIY